MIWVLFLVLILVLEVPSNFCIRSVVGKITVIRIVHVFICLSLMSIRSSRSVGIIHRFLQSISIWIGLSELLQISIFYLVRSLLFTHNILTYPLVISVPVDFIGMSCRGVVTWDITLVNVIAERVWWPRIVALHLRWINYLVVGWMFRITTHIVYRILIVLIISRLVESIRSEHHYLISTVIIRRGNCWIVRILSLPRVSKLCRIMFSRFSITSFWRWLWELTHYWTIN